MKNFYSFCITLLWVLWSGIGMAQTIQISGTVISEQEKTPLPGVSIIAGDSGNGTITDENGAFHIEIPRGSSLQFSDLGYQTQTLKPTGNQSDLIIRLKESTNDLNELVVTALGITKEKKSLGYSVQEIKSKDINETSEPNLVNALSGKAAGVRITNSQGDMGSSRIIIRGETSISGNNQPLFVIDGVPVDNTQFLGGPESTGQESTRDFSNAIADINPNDIASISVLKGPNAAALYGSRASAGVILIKTKNGKETKGLGVSLHSNFTISNPLIIPDYQNVFGQGSNGQFSYVDGAGGGINDAVDESWGPKMEGQLIPQFYSNGEAVPFEPHPNNIKSFYNTGTQFDNGVSVAGSKDDYHFRFSYDNRTQHGIIPGTSQKRNSFSVNAGYHILPNLSIDVMANYISLDAPNLPGGKSFRSSSPLLQFNWFGRQVDMAKLKDFYEKGDPTNWNNLYYSNPYFVSHVNTVRQNRDRLIGSVNLTYDLTDEWSLFFRTGHDHYTDRRKIKVAFDTKGTPFGSYEEDAFATTENNTEGRINYNHQINSDFSIELMGGGNIRTNSTENNDQIAPQLAAADVYTLSNSRVPLVSNNYDTKLKTYSLYGSAQVGFKDYAYLNLTARNDWSSSLPTAHASYFYPSVNGSIVLSEALHLTNDNINLLKIRGGWSDVGKATSAYQLINTYGFNPLFGNHPQLQADAVDLNPNLKPEETRSTEVGIEGSFFDNRVSLDVSLYDMNSFNQIIAVDVSASTGFQQQLINGGKINNKGLEIELGLTPIRTTNFSWDTHFNFSTNKSKVISLDKELGLTSFLLGSALTIDVLASVGEPYGALYGPNYQRADNGEIVIDGSGHPVLDPNKVYLGRYTPRWQGSFSNEFTWKNWSLNFLIDAHIGGSIYSQTNRTATYTGTLASTLPGRDADHGGLLYYYPNDDHSLPAIQVTNESEAGGAQVHDDGMIFKGVLEDGKENEKIIPAQDYYKTLSDVDAAFIYSATYVKLREVRLGYLLPFSFLKSVGIQNASLTLVGRNLWIMNNHAPNIDPETAFDTGNGQGLEYFTLPTVRSFGIDLNLTF